MRVKNSERYEVRAEILKALAHPTRLLIVDALGDGPRCVCKITELTESDISTVSRHLSVLKTAGLIRDEKKGNQVFYHLICPCLGGLFKCIETVVEQNRKTALQRMGE